MTTEQPTFTAIATTDLPAVKKGVDPATIALGNAILAVLTPESAARDGNAYAERNDAVNRGAVLKRAVRSVGTPNGHTVGVRILSESDGYHVAVTLNAAKAKKSK